ncbi:MAG: InlB B-repeat-containing protein [Bacilli bacterium]|nr:InlB B-repeat-containing protein [Bacilli bacterium]
MEQQEKRTCYNCGGRLRPGARFCSTCGAIIRTPKKEEAPQPVQETTTQVQQPDQTPVRNTKVEAKKQPKELFFYEKTSKKQRTAKKEEKDTFAFELAGNNVTLWNVLTAVTSVIALVLGIVLLSVSFMGVTYEGFNIVLSMQDCLNVLFSKDIPIFYEITTEIAGLCSVIGVFGLLYFLTSVGSVGYNLVMYGKYNKRGLLINTIFSGVLTVFAIVLLALYLSVKGQLDLVGGVNGYSSYSVVLLIVSVVVLLLDAAKLTILYQKKVAEKDNPSYALNFLSTLGKNIWKYLSIGAAAVGAVVVLVIVLLATAKSPAIKVWEEYVGAFNEENIVKISECYYPVEANENRDAQEYYKNVFGVEGRDALTKGKAKVLLQTEKYIKISVEGVEYTKATGEKSTHDLDLHFGKVDGEWYLMSYIDLGINGNNVTINNFNQAVSETLLKINDTTVRGFSLKLGKKDIESITEIVLPEGITKIETGAFEGLTNLKTLVLPNTVTTIEAGAFKGCENLTTVKLSNKLVTLGESAFEGCALMEEVILAETVTTVGKNAFKDCANLTIYTHFDVKPEGFDPEWNVSECKVYLDKQWGHDEQDPTRINLLNIYANGGEYELEDDEYFENGEYATLPTPTKKGCEFLGWYTTPHFDETTKLTSSSVLMNGDVSVYAKWNENAYSIKYNLDGGTLVNMVTTYKVGDTIVLGTPTKKGYTFVGWTGTGLDEVTEVVEISGETGDREYTAVFKANIYTITFNANGGNGSGKVQVTFNTNAVLNTSEFIYAGMRLVEWNTEKDGTGTVYKLNQEFLYTIDSDITLYAQWASLITLEQGSHAKLNGTAPRIIIGQKNYTIPVPETKEYLFFDGWYLGEQQITDSEGKGLAAWTTNSAVTLTAKWVDKITVDGITYMYRGEYPQSRVTDKDLIDALSKLKSTNARGYYSYNGEQYAKVKFDNALSKVNFNDGTKVSYGTTYYFKVEKILWRVLDDAELLLISEFILDASIYYDENETRLYFDTHQNKEVSVYPNNYAESTIDAWLNNDVVKRYDESGSEVSFQTNGFATKAFKDVAEVVQYTLDIDNSLESTLADTSPYVWGNSQGYFFLLSHEEYAETYKAKLGNGVALVTDYAIAKEVAVESGAGSWWLRSPYHASGKKALYINETGAVRNELITKETLGVRPAMYLREVK